MGNLFYGHILERIINVARNNSHDNAFFIDGKSYDYSQFLSSIISISEMIRNGSGVCQVVGLVANNDLQTYASIVALWINGKAYMPLNIAEPLQRAGQMINTLGIDTILDSSLGERFSTLGADVIYTGGASDVSRSSVAEDILFTENIDDDERAYVIFTSGSTGVPKAVPITRKNLLTMFDAFEKEGYEFTGKDRVLQCNDLTFDLSVIAYLLPMMTGACCYTVPGDVIKYLYIYDLFEEQEITIAMIGPSTILSLKPYFDEINAPSVRYCYVIGEKLPANILPDWQKCLPNASIENYYGPTEATVWCTYYKYFAGHEKSYNGALSVGRPLNGVGVLIVDENNMPVPAGSHGELCLSGDQVTDGYVGDSELNSKVFFLYDGVKYYKTGDMCFMDSDGDIMFVGRGDSQIKVKGGLRIEIGEVEYRAQQALGMNVVVIPYTDSSEMTELAMFVEHEQLAQKEVLDRLADMLHPYMMPAKLLFMNKFPLNKNGKIDRKSLYSSIN